MGYDLHITRAADWSERDKPEISLVEWQEFVGENSDFDGTGAAETMNPETGEVIRIEQPGIALWRGHSTTPVWLSWWRGTIVVKNPDPETISKMTTIAAALGARVQGDDSEWYDEPGRKKPWWKFW